MAWCCQPTSHYPNQCLPIMSRILCHSPKGNSTANANESNQYNTNLKITDLKSKPHLPEGNGFTTTKHNKVLTLCVFRSMYYNYWDVLQQYLTMVAKIFFFPFEVEEGLARFSDSVMLHTCFADTADTAKHITRPHSWYQGRVLQRLNTSS